MFLEERYLTNKAGPLLRSACEAALMNLGIGGLYLFGADYKLFKSLLPPSWIKSTWEFLFTHNVSIPTNCADLKLRREGDFYLMERFQTLGYKCKQLAALNRCRLFLQVTSAADIVDGSGDQLSKEAYIGRKNSYRRSSYVWPSQQSPSKPTWAKWRQALRKAFLRQNQLMIHPLGKCVDNDRDTWQWFVCHTWKDLCHKA